MGSGSGLAHLDEPVDQDGAHLRRHVALERHVVVVHRALVRVRVSAS